MKEFTVIGYYSGTNQIFSHCVSAKYPLAAFTEVAKKFGEDAVFVTVISGHLREGQGIEFPGSALVDGETVLAQPDVFDKGDIKPFKALSASELVEWMAVARKIAEDRDQPIDLDDHVEAQRQAEQHYVSLDGELPLSPIQKIANQMILRLRNTSVVLSGKLKTVNVTLAAMTRQDYSEEVVVPVEFDDSMLDAMMCAAYERMDATQFNDDPDYWEKGNCYHEVIG